jgi:hypothetical protein
MGLLWQLRPVSRSGNGSSTQLNCRQTSASLPSTGTPRAARRPDATERLGTPLRRPNAAHGVCPRPTGARQMQAIPILWRTT